ncbi:ABC transporter substrate-binding protein [Pararhizobium mangrovi]|uniref:Nitrate ABC transporter substrate-binding protein n=1 Tax=Pararhizobium mangrovi TaxID=2590452 RepID=A0A506U948_9HYPH|nr:ABC transporter substrate-binding protein [Pararhizobium mangrovi]TPW30410.1 nitrate ABC transporter substrate-binding protein [Pararhizobium mangrovi]
MKSSLAMKSALTMKSALGLIALALAAAFATGSSARAADKVTVGVIPIVDVAPIYLGKEKGFFEKQGIDLTLQLAQGGAAIVPSVVSGQYQFGFSNMTSLIVAQSRGLDFKVVAAGDSSTGKAGKDFSAIVVPKDSTISGAGDLAGKTVAVNNLKNIGDTTVKAAMRKAGGDPSGVKFVELAFPDMPAAVANGRVDAAWVVEPFLTITRDQGAKVVSWNLVDTADRLMTAAYFTTARYAKSHPDIVKRFTAAMNQSLDYAQNHREEARRELLSYTRIPKDVVDRITLPDWTTKINRKSTQTLADLAVKDGLVKKRPDLGSLLP